MEKINRKTSNSRVNLGLLADVFGIFLSRSFCTNSMTRDSSAKSFIRAWKVMEMCYEILVQEKRVTNDNCFTSYCVRRRITSLLNDRSIKQSKVCRLCLKYSISAFLIDHLVICYIDVVALLRRSRFSLGIMASSRGAVAGHLFLQEPRQEIIDCTTCGSSGYPISGDRDLLEKLIMKTDACYIFVIEKVEGGGRSKTVKDARIHRPFCPNCHHINI